MTGPEIIAQVKSLQLPEGSYIVFGSCPLALAGIREAGDIDMLVNQALFDELRKAGWQEIDKGPGDKPLTHDVFEAHTAWDFAAYQPTLHELLSDATVVEGIPFASLSAVRQWKAASGRPKDLVDLQLIDKHIRVTRDV